jgi:hypothetical protein
MSIMATLKTIDTIGEIDEQIAALKKKRDKLADRLKDYRGVGSYEGDLYEASVYEADSTKPNIPKLKKHFGANWHKYLVKKTMVCLRVQKKSKRRRKAKE